MFYNLCEGEYVEPGFCVEPAVVLAGSVVLVSLPALVAPPAVVVCWGSFCQRIISRQNNTEKYQPDECYQY